MRVAVIYSCCGSQETVSYINLDYVGYCSPKHIAKALLEEMFRERKLIKSIADIEVFNSAYDWFNRNEYLRDIEKEINNQLISKEVSQ